jgi:hypothetical protein
MNAPLPESLLERIRAEYLELPGWCLTLEQMQRLGRVERTRCKRVLDALVDATLLCVKSDGTYARLTDAETSRVRAAKADLSRPHTLTPRS